MRVPVGPLLILSKVRVVGYSSPIRSAPSTVICGVGFGPCSDPWSAACSRSAVELNLQIGGIRPTTGFEVLRLCRLHRHQLVDLRNLESEHYNR
jgi:hypothetical protein